MAEHWFRWHHGSINDPKWRVVAMRAGVKLSHNVPQRPTTSHDVPVCHVIAVWAAMLECASQAGERGSLADWDDEDVAVGLGLDQAEVAAIRTAMEGKVIADGFVSAWNKRQPKREDARPAGRKRAAELPPTRSGDCGTLRDNGECPTPSHKVPLEERRGEESLLSSYEERSANSADPPQAEPSQSDAAAMPDDPGGGESSAPPCPHQAIIALYHEILPELRQVRVWTNTRQGMLQRRWREDRDRQDLGWWRDLFGYVRDSDWLMGREPGRDGRPFDCDLEWIIGPKNIAKIVEGKYESRGAGR